MLRVCALLVIPLMLPVGQIRAEQPSPSDPLVERGRAVAENICSACHIVGANPKYSTVLNQGPDFRKIANEPNVTEESLTGFLHGTHKMLAEPYVMPNPRLTDDMISEVVAYILSLRTQH